MTIDRAARLRNAEILLRQGKLDQAMAEYRRIVDEQPRDWNTANVLGDLYFRGGQIDKAVEQYTRIADSLSLDGFLSKAAALYKKVLKIRPRDEHVLLQAAEIAAGQDLLVEARSYLNALLDVRRGRGDAAGVASITIRMAALDPSDYDARLAGALAQAEVGDLPGAVSALKQLAAELTDQELLEPAVVALREAGRLAPADVEVKLALAQLLVGRTDVESGDEASQLATELADEAIARGDWTSAASALQQAVARLPTDIPVLLRLVAVGVDGGLDDVASAAQTQLADAYLEAGSALEARFIAEDLVVRHRDDRQHLERLRRALTMLGETNPDDVIAGWLAGLEPIAAPNALESVSEEVVPPSGEIDLSVVLEEFKPAPVPPITAAARDLDDVFADLRDEATRRIATNNPDRELAAGLAFYGASQLDFAIPRLEAASRNPANRFEAASTLGRIFLERGETWHAIEWLERAADAPAPSPADGHRLLYELADALEGVGEVARALAICLELRAEAGDYQDVATRVDRLAKVQARG